MHEVTELRNKVTEFKVMVSLSKISKDEIREMRRRTPLYIEWKGVEDEATPSSEAKPMGTLHVFKALNARRLEESHVNNFPTSLTVL